MDDSLGPMPSACMRLAFSLKALGQLSHADEGRIGLLRFAQGDLHAHIVAMDSARERS